MLIDFEQLRSVLDDTGYKVFRDKAPKKTAYPYIIYSFISKGKKKASGKVYKRFPLYQISLFTVGTEKDLRPIESAFEKLSIPYADFASIQGDENDDTVTNFYTQVKVAENGE